MALVIADTGPLFALLDRREEHHLWTIDQLRSLRTPLLTCDAVLTETCYLLSKSQLALHQLRTYLERGIIVSEFATKSEMSHIFALMETYRNVPMSFADACLVCMVENHPVSAVFTLDRDFKIYRQQKRRLIPLIAPF